MTLADLKSFKEAILKAILIAIAIAVIFFIELSVSILAGDISLRTGSFKL